MNRRICLGDRPEASLWALSAPLIVGSAYGLISAGMAVLPLIISTILEDRTLLRELTGYSEYARRVHYRLIPGLWVNQAGSVDFLMEG